MLSILKAEVLSVLADAYDETAWSDATLEEGMRQALVMFPIYGVMREETFTLLEDGYEHDLSSLQPHAVLVIGYPWGDGYRLSDVTTYAWRMVGEAKVRFDDLDLGAGEEVRVQYHKRHTIQHLDGATETTFWEIEQRRFVLLAAHFCLRLRIRYYAHAGSFEERSRIPALTQAEVGLLAQFVAFEMPQASSSGFVVWGPMGQC